MSHDGGAPLARLVTLSAPVGETETEFWRRKAAERAELLQREREQREYADYLLAVAVAELSVRREESVQEVVEHLDRWADEFRRAQEEAS